MYAVYMVGQKSHKVPPIQQSVTINGTEVTFEVYTGCSVTVLSRKQYVKLRALAVLPKLEACLVKLKTYTGERLRVKGMVHVTRTHENVSRVLPLIVVAGSGPNLLGRSWLQELVMEVHPVHQVESLHQGAPARNNQLEQLLRKHEAVF